MLDDLVMQRVAVQPHPLQTQAVVFLLGGQMLPSSGIAQQNRAYARRQETVHLGMLG